MVTSLPYFGVKLSCVCLMCAYRTSLNSVRKLLDLFCPYFACLCLHLLTFAYTNWAYSYANMSYSGLKVTHS